MLLRTTIVLCLATPVMAQAIYSPPAAALGFGNVNNTLPFRQQTNQYMQIHDATSFQPQGLAILTRMQFRPKADTTGGSCDLELFFARCPHSSRQADSTFANNVTPGTEMNVFTRKTINLPNVLANQWGGPDLVFDVPFAMLPNTNVSWRVVIHSNSSTAYTLDCYSDWRFGTPTAHNGCQHPLGTRTAQHNSTFRSPGNVWDLNGYSYVPNTVFPGAVTIGGSASLWGSLTLPFDMGPIGAPGCEIVNDPAIVIGGVTGSNVTGFMQVLVPTPNDPGLVGATIYSQYFFVDAGANPLGIFSSNGRINLNIPDSIGITRIYSTNPGATTGTVGLDFALPIGLN